MFDIYITTFGREKKLQRCVNSILANDFKDWRLVINYDIKHEFVFKVWSRELRTMQHPWTLCICDDVELYPDCLSILARKCEELFPDTDGLIGFNQANIPPDKEGYSKSAQAIVGRKFVERFGDHPVYCPDYRSFGADAELGHFARLIDKFYWCEEAKLTHYHPAHCPEEIDETHHIVRAGNIVQIDNDKYQQRVVKLGWTWGKDFNRLCL